MRRVVVLVLSIFVMNVDAVHGDHIFSANDDSITYYDPYADPYERLGRYVTGDGNVTIDASTNLAWLDLTLTKGLSYNDVLPMLNAGGDFAGYRVASLNELVSFWEHAGITVPNNAEFEDSAAIRSLQRLWGITTTEYIEVGIEVGLGSRILTVWDDGTSMGLSLLANFAWVPVDPAYTTANDTALPEWMTVNPDQRNSWRFSAFAPALVRTASDIIPVPAPSSLNCLVGVGSMLVLMDRWKKRRRRVRG